MFWKLFSGAFGLVLGILLAFIAFIIIVAVILATGEYLEEKAKAKQKQKCLRCQEKRKKKIILAEKKYPTEKLCPDCKEVQEEVQKDESFIIYSERRDC